jgi:hypothetical protein
MEGEIMGKKSAIVRHDENPFLEGPLVYKPKNKAMVVGAGNTVLLNQDTGEVSPTKIISYQEVDPEKFVKLYTAEIRALFDLTNPSFRLMEIIFLQVQQHAVDKDVIYLNLQMTEKFFHEHERPAMSKSTFYRAVGELAQRGIIAASTNQNLYFINPRIFFNGDRVTFIRHVTKKKKSGSTIPDLRQLDLLEAPERRVASR